MSQNLYCDGNHLQSMASLSGESIQRGKLAYTSIGDPVASEILALQDLYVCVHVALPICVHVMYTSFIKCLVVTQHIIRV